MFVSLEGDSNPSFTGVWSCQDENERDGGRKVRGKGETPSGQADGKCFII